MSSRESLMSSLESNRVFFATTRINSIRVILFGKLTFWAHNLDLSKLYNLDRLKLTFNTTPVPLTISLLLY